MWILFNFITLILISKISAEEFICNKKGQTVIAESGIIKTPGYDTSSAYPPKTICHWIFPAQNGKFIHFEFLKFDLELSNDCKPDAIEIWIIKKPAHLLKKLCGSKPLSSIVVSADTPIGLTFRSDDMYEAEGAVIKFTVVDSDPSCSENQFKCKNDVCIPSQKKCDNSDNCGDGSDEENCNYKVEIPKECGKPKHSPEVGNGDRIIGGKVARPHSWPWQISIQNIASYPSGHFCGGALINNLWVVTAAHCLFGRSVNGYRIHFGKHERFSKDKDEIVRYAVTQCVHPDFHRQLMKDDIAVIKLNAPVNYNDVIQPVCIPQLMENLEEGTFCHVTGWGSTYGTGDYHLLKQAMVPIISYDKCNEMKKLLKLSPNTYCAGYSKGFHAPCFGDSGGPLVCNYDDSWKLSGIVSWGPMTCGIKEPTIYTKISDYKPWIEKIINNNENNMPNRCG